MQALIDLIVGFVALLAAAALSQFGLDMSAPRKAQREVHRVHDCGDQASTASLIAAKGTRREC
jgi:hypothetical protein